CRIATTRTTALHRINAINVLKRGVEHNKGRNREITAHIAAPVGTLVHRRGKEEFMTTYNDIFVRDNFGDTGQTPSNGNPYMSPDIIPYQNGQLTWTQITSTYPNGPDLGKSIVMPGPNNIYIRAKNLQPTGTESGTNSLYYGPSSLFMLPS